MAGWAVTWVELRFDKKTRQFPPDQLAKIAQLGDAGWQLVSVTTDHWEGGGAGMTVLAYILWFQRPKSEMS